MGTLPMRRPVDGRLYLKTPSGRSLPDRAAIRHRAFKCSTACRTATGPAPPLSRLGLSWLHQTQVVETAK